MNRRGVEFTLVQVERDLWQWQFRIGDTVTTGKTKTRLKGMAARRAQMRIDRELNKPRDLNHLRADSAGSPDSFQAARSTGAPLDVRRRSPDA